MLQQRARAIGRGGLVARAVELVVLFVAGPLALTLYVPTRSMAPILFPVLWLVGGVCVMVLCADRTFDRRQLWNRAGFWHGVRRAVLVFVPLGGLVVLGVWLFRPDLFLNFPRERPALWAFVMVGYPLASVYPQEVIWRAFFFHRYEPLMLRILERLGLASMHGNDDDFEGGESAGAEVHAVEGEDRNSGRHRSGAERGSGDVTATVATIILSAVLFGFMHILFKHWIGVVLTLAGGAFFAVSYARYRSLALTWLEHALWGCLVFTAGLGQFFYLGAVAARG